MNGRVFIGTALLALVLTGCATRPRPSGYVPPSQPTPPSEQEPEEPEEPEEEEPEEPEEETEVVTLCHKKKTRTVTLYELSEHLGHGDYLGVCE